MVVCFSCKLSLSINAISCSDSWEMTEQEINTQNVITIQWEGVVEDTQWVSTTDNPSYEIITQ